MDKNWLRTSLTLDENWEVVDVILISSAPLVLPLLAKLLLISTLILSSVQCIVCIIQYYIDNHQR